MDEHDYELVIAFDTDDPEFCRGFEAASVDSNCERFVDSHEDEHCETVHATNAEMMLRIAERHGLQVRCEELDERWITVIFTR